MEFLTANQKRYDAAQFSARAILSARNSRRAILGAAPTASLPTTTSAGCSPTPPPSTKWRVTIDVQGRGRHIDAANKNVVVIGGGDTGTDPCIGTSLRHGCETPTNFAVTVLRPRHARRGQFARRRPRIYRTDYGHEEAAHRYGALTSGV